MSDRWFRLYDDLVDDPKVQRLPDALFKALVNLWCLASKNAGRLPSVEDIAFRLRLKPEKVKSILEALVSAELIDEDETEMRPHNWNGRQFKSDVSTDRVKQHRERKMGVSGNVSSTLHETPPEAETEQKQSSVAKATGVPPPIETQERALFERGKEVLGTSAGGQIAKLLKAKGGSIPLARAAIEQASIKHRPAEYIGAIIRGAANPDETQATVKVAI